MRFRAPPFRVKVTGSTVRIGVLVIAVTAALAAGACGDGGDSDESGEAPPETTPQPTEAELAAANLDKLPLAPESRRVDLAAPSFSSPTEITNPLFPISELHSAILTGRVEGKAFHTETTLLPETRMIEWAPGQWVEALISQYHASLDGRIEEVALDYYAQADDGSVWYLGEDVFDYNRAGLVVSTEGTWLAGREGPPEMIMPAAPTVGDVHRAENIPSVAFEEVAIKKTGETVSGPRGSVEGAIIARELHDDGTYSDKVFAPGYGEFFTADAGDVEAIALAVPTDALDGPVPHELSALSAAATETYKAVRSANWKGANMRNQDVVQAWRRYRESQVPPRLAREMQRSIRALGEAIAARDRGAAGIAAIDVSQSELDLELRHRPPAEIDLARFELWGRQIVVDAAAGDLGGVHGDVVTMEWIRDRFANTLTALELTRIDTHLLALREAVADHDPDAASAEATRVGNTVAAIESPR
jgi:hypothetical protein